MLPEIQYAPYVWGSYAAFALILVWQILQPIIRRRRVHAEIREQLAERTGSYSSPTGGAAGRQPTQHGGQDA